MNESGATAFEVQQLARYYEGSGMATYMRMPAHYRNAILVEALLLLATKKEAERAARP